MENPKNKVIIDTNLWISFLLTKDLSIFDKIIAVNKLTLIFIQELVDEFVEVSQRSKFRNTLLWMTSRIYWLKSITELYSLL